MEDESNGQTSRGARLFFIIVSGGGGVARVCQVHIYQQSGLKEVDDESIEKLK